MNNRQLHNVYGKIAFINNINKLSKGRRTSFYKENADNTISLLATVRCDTKGVRPRKFSVTNSDVIPVGSNYSLKTIERHLLDDEILS